MASGFSSKHLGKEIDNEISYVKEELRDIIKRHENNIEDISNELNDVSTKIPTKVSELENDKGYMLSTDLVGQTIIEEKINTEIADRENGDKELADDLTETDTALRALIEEERLSRKSDIAVLKNSKVNTENVLTKDNTTAYSPTNNYHPVTKKYVDDIAINSGAGDMLRAVYDMDGSGVVDDSEKLGGVEAEKYALQAQVQEKVNEIHTVLQGGVLTVTVEVGEIIPENAVKIVEIIVPDTIPDTSAKYISTSDTIAAAYVGSNVICCRGERINMITIPGGGRIYTCTEDAFVVFEVELLPQIKDTPPELTATSPDGTMIGSDGWTGTGFMCTAENTKYEVISSDISSRIVGFNRFCLRFADVSGNKWKNWSPWLDIDGVTYEFFYSPARKLYEALIPATTLNAEEIVSLIRWERAEPDIVRYGKVSNMFGSTTVVSDDGTETTTYSMHTEEGSLRDCCGNYIDADTQVGMAFFSGDITLPTENIPQSIFVKLYLSLDTNCDGSFKAQDVTAIGRKVKGAAAFTVETIDNFA